jgi:hypothetical protein
MIAFCFCGGQVCTSGRTVHSAGMVLGSLWRIAAILVLVQCHITGPLPHTTILCCSESVFRHFAHKIVSVRRMVVRRSFVGSMSCIAWYHVEMTVSDASTVYRFFHTLIFNQCIKYTKQYNFMLRYITLHYIRCCVHQHLFLSNKLQVR